MVGKKQKEIMAENTETKSQTGYNVESSHFREVNKSMKQLEKEYDEEIRIRRAACSAFEVVFAEKYVVSGNAGEAARLAGSKAQKTHVVGANTLKRPHVKAYVEILMKKATMRASLQASDVLEMIRRVYEKAMEEGNLKEANVASKNLADAMGLGKKDSTITEEITAKEREVEDRKEELLSRIREKNMAKSENVVGAK